MNRNIITHKNRIPEFNDRIYYINACDNSQTLPAGIGTPSLWYRMDAATASTSTANRNTVIASEYHRWYNFGTSQTTRPNGVNLDYKDFGAGSRRFQQPTARVNGLTTAESVNQYAEWMVWSELTFANAFSTAGVGTVVMAWRSGSSSYNAPGLLEFSAQNKNNLTSGFYSNYGDNSITTIFGDNQTYSFTSTPMNTDCIRIVSVQSAGNPLFYKQNGVQGLTSSYNPYVGVGSIWSVDLNQIQSLDQDELLFYEAMYWESALSAADCQKVEDYLSKKWCIYW